VATDSAGQAFSAVAVCRRLSRDIPQSIEAAAKTADIVELPSALRVSAWARQVMEGGYLNMTRRELYMLELGLT